MPLDLDKDLGLSAALRAGAASLAAATPPRCTVEVVVDRDNEAAGSVSLEVQGFSVEEARRLRSAFDGAGEALRRIETYRARRKRELNPGGDALGAEAVGALVDGETEPWREKALKAAFASAREICALGIVGYPEGELRRGGSLVPFAVVEQGGRKVLCAEALDLLTDAHLLLETALWILRVSAGETPVSAADQWARRREEKEKSKEGKPAPFDTAAPLSTPKISRGRSGSPSQRGSLSASGSGPKRPAR